MQWRVVESRRLLRRMNSDTIVAHLLYMYSYTSTCVAGARTYHTEFWLTKKAGRSAVNARDGTKTREVYTYHASAAASISEGYSTVRDRPKHTLLHGG